MNSSASSRVWSTLGRAAEMVRPQLRSTPLPVLTFKGLGADGFLTTSESEAGKFALSYPGDIVFTKGGHAPGWAFKKVGIVPASQKQGLHVAGTLQVVRPTTEFEPRYLYYWLASPMVYDHVQASVGGRNGITGGMVKGVPVPCAELDEQRRIVETLDDNLSRLASAVESLHSAQSRSLVLAQSAAWAAVMAPSYPVVPFERVFEKISRTGIELKQRDYLSEGRFPVVDQGAGLIAGYANDESNVMRLGGPVVLFGDHTRAVKFIDFDFVPGADGLQVLRPREGVNSRFAFYALKALPLRDRGYARHFAEVRRSSFPLPSAEVQGSIAVHLDGVLGALERTDAFLGAALETSRSIYRSLLQVAFASHSVGGIDGD